MKAYKYIYRLFIASLAAAVWFLLLPACKKDHNDSLGTPEIKRVRLLHPSLKDSTITAALPGTEVVLQGENIGGVVKIFFNDAEARFNPAYNTTTNMIVIIPRTAPTAATKPDVTNLIRMVTSHGETTFSFTLTPPKPNILWVKNENTIPGNQMTIMGENMFRIENISFPGGNVVNDFTASADGTQVLVTVPAGIGSESGRLFLKAVYGTDSSDGPVNKITGDGMISNFSKPTDYAWGVNNWSGWGAVVTAANDLFPGNREHYIQHNFGGVTAWEGTWWLNNRTGVFDSVKVFTSSDMLTEPAANYALKFEINTKEAWKAGYIVLRFNNLYANRWTPYLSLPGMTFNTENKWQTATIPLSEFRLNEGKGNAATFIGNLVAPTGKTLFNYRFITEVDPWPVFNAAFDNFRIVKIK